jgi:hypothetical protein
MSLFCHEDRKNSSCGGKIKDLKNAADKNLKSGCSMGMLPRAVDFEVPKKN